ncbi:M23 family metallopeptidase [Streptomyces sp. JJ36]|uniref:M23 family metallopeptidase n=1 Tax=Streptomyces sp. JJ36 TaxID=2736645 RepID=UPI001F298256|nr:M23 family metallopeptidase [Streptomyces sp. JJ36]MCF6521503.1 M23 family metallopeptidase [Streptomyces sp. JJ36]
MPNRISISAIRHRFRTRTRTAVVSAGLCASLAVGAGAAIAGVPQDASEASGGSAKAAQAAAPHEAKAGKAGDGAKSEGSKGSEDGKDAGKKGDAGKKAEAEKDAEKKAAEKKAAKKKAAKKKAAEKKAAKARKADAKKKASRNAKRDWISPVSEPFTLTASFADSGARWSASHSGQDFAVPTGTPVKAVHKGTVVTTGWGGAYGNRIVVEHPNGKYSQYAHLSKINVSPGQHVNTGSKIGMSGNTGNTSGPHLHFELRTTPVYGSGFDPMPYLRAHGANL